MSDTTSTSMDTVIGRMVVEKGLATQGEVDQCMMLTESAANDGKDVGGLSGMLISQGIVTQAQLQRLKPELDEQKSSRQIPGYQMLSKLGAGAMATVYKAKQLSLDRTVAIKVLPQKHSNDPNFIQRFYDEGKAAAKLNHANVVGPYDVGQAGEYHYFVMEYVDGRTVYDDISSKGAYREKEALNITTKVAEALSHAHEAGFIHRDVKPKNIMIANDGTVKLADMGLARAVSDREAAEAEAGKAYGTPYYISPEQIRGEIEIDFRADIYALGATAYHMVTGRVPFEGANPSAVMRKHLSEELEPPDHINEDLSSGFSEIIEICMAKSPKKRYGTTEDLLHDLQAVNRGEPPIIARKMVDLSSLAALEPDDTQVLPVQRVGSGSAGSSQSLTEQPLFWVAMGEAAAIIVLIAVLVISLSG
ncbi:MAG: serine/threonine protein kinase [Phycisphaeraceae bacterium]|nr:serine/threonine protein kinase [Phycisphaeraceae bacterium]